MVKISEQTGYQFSKEMYLKVVLRYSPLKFYLTLQLQANRIFKIIISWVSNNIFSSGKKILSNYVALYKISKNHF